MEVSCGAPPELDVVVERALSKLSPEQRVGLLVGGAFWASVGEDSVGMRPVVFSDGPVGVRQQLTEAAGQVLVPRRGRGSVSAWLGIAQNVGILGGAYVAQMFATNPLMLFVAPSILAIGAMVLFAVILPDQHMPVKPPRMNLAEWVTTFWLSPRRYPDFALAWWSRFLIILATFMFTTFRLFYLQDQVGVLEADAPAVVSVGVLIYTLTLVASGWVAGKISDRTGRRKLLVAGSSLLFGLGIVLLVQVDTVEGFYWVEALLGLAYGIYVGVDLALVIDCLPNPDDSGKDLGVFNMANALPQTAAPVIGVALLAVNSVGNQNYDLLLYTAGVLALIGALVVLPIKSVR